MLLTVSEKLIVRPIVVRIRRICKGPRTDRAWGWFASNSEESEHLAHKVLLECAWSSIWGIFIAEGGIQTNLTAVMNGGQGLCWSKGQVIRGNPIWNTCFVPWRIQPFLIDIHGSCSYLTFVFNTLYRLRICERLSFTWYASDPIESCSSLRSVTIR